MDYSLLGPTGVKVSKICLGTATFGVAPDAQEAEHVVHAALDLGINFSDTANVYGASPTFDRPGVPPREPAELILGRALAGRRDDVVQFRIAGGTPEVSWQVTGVRHDQYAQAHPTALGDEKPPEQRGHYLDPDLHGLPPEGSMESAMDPTAMRQVRHQRAALRVAVDQVW
jgi:hypothetical protein